MTQEINALYKGDMEELIRTDHHFRWIDHEAIELSKKEGSATIIRVREGLPSIDKVAINILKYDGKNNGKTTAETVSVPRTLINKIVEIYK